MSNDTPYLDGLDSLADRPAHACPKPVPRLVTRVERDRDIDRAWQALCRYVDERDRYRCRVCRRRLVKTLTLCVERLERHHLETRALRPSLTLDPRNVICVCAACHGKLTRHEIEPTSPDRFEFNGHWYLNADCPLTFLTR
jgi:hypothetical protein